MGIATVVVSGVALLVASASAWYARRQAIESRRQAAASEETVRIDRERREKERTDRARADLAAATADVFMEIQRTIGLDYRPMLRVVNRGPHEASDVHALFIDANDSLVAPETSQWGELSSTEPLQSGGARWVPWNVEYETTSDFRTVIEWTDGHGRQRQEFRVRA